MTAQTSLFELTERDRILDNLEERRAEWVTKLRELMRNLYSARLVVRGWPAPDVYVTTDDARKLFESWDVPSADEVSRNFMGALFRGEKGWKAVGFVNSTVAGSHGNLIRKWQWRG